MTIERDAARKTPNVRATVQELYDGLTRISQNRWPSLAFDVGAVNDLASPMFSAGFYYKTFMWPKAAWKTHLRAEHPRRRRPRRRARPARSRPLFLALCALRGAGAGRRRGRHRRSARGGRNRRARHPLRRAGGVRRRAALREPARRSTARTAGAGRRRRSRSLRRWTMSACCRAPRRSATTRRISSGWSSASATISPSPAMTCRASGCGRCARSAWSSPPARSSGTWCLPTTTGRASCWRRRRAPISTTTASRSASNVGVYTANDSAYAAAIDLKKAGVNVAAIVDLRDNPTGPAVDEARGARHRDQPWPRRHPRRRQAARVVDDRAGQGRRAGAHHPGRRDPDVGRLDAVGAHVLAVARQGRLRRRDQALPARPVRAGLRFRRRVQRHRRPCRDDRRGARRGREGGQGSRRQVRQGRQAQGRDVARAGPAAWSARHPAPARTRRSKPSSISRTTSPPRTSGSPCAKACARSSTSSASPPTAWRPTRARPRTCTAWPSRPRRWARTFRRSA